MTPPDVPDVTPHPDRRWRWLAACLVGLEGGVPLGLAVAYLVELARGTAGDARNVVMLVALLAVLGGGLLALARLLLRGRRGARSPSLTWQLLLLPIASYVWGGGRHLAAVAVVVVAVLAGVASVLATVEREPADPAPQG